MGKAKEWTGEGQKANTGIENAKSKWGGGDKNHDNSNIWTYNKKYLWDSERGMKEQYFL
jgi:hypothetical protein